MGTWKASPPPTVDGGVREREERLMSGPEDPTVGLCARSRDDANYARYPRLPMLTCPGFEPGEPEGPEPDDGA